MKFNSTVKYVLCTLKFFGYNNLNNFKITLLIGVFVDRFRSILTKFMTKLNQI